MKIYISALASAMLVGLLASAPTSADQAGNTALTRPVVSEFIQVVLEGHPGLAAARAELDAARARARGQGRPLYNPELEFEYENAEETTREIGVSQAFDLSGKRGARSRVARSEVEAATASFDIARKNLLADVLISLADYQANLELFRLSERRVELSSEFLVLAERRNTAGDLPLTELLTARLALAEAVVEKSAARSALSLSEEKLIAISGEHRSVWPMLLGVPPITLPTGDTNLLDSLPELRLARAASETSRSRIQVAQRDRIPDPTVGVRYGEEGQRSLVGLKLAIPLPVRNSYRAEVDAARAELIAAEQNYGQLSRRASARLETAESRYLTVTDAWGLWNSNGAEHLYEQRKVIQQLWQVGEINAVNYFIQLDQTFSAEKASVELRGQLWAMWFEWLDASGLVSEWMETIR